MQDNSTKCKKVNKRHGRRRDEELYPEAYDAVLFVEIEIIFGEKCPLNVAGRSVSIAASSFSLQDSLEDFGSTFVRNVGTCLSNYTSYRLPHPCLMLKLFARLNKLQAMKMR